MGLLDFFRRKKTFKRVIDVGTPFERTEYHTIEKTKQGTFEFVTPYNPDDIPNYSPPPQKKVKSVLNFLVNDLKCLTVNAVQGFPYDLDCPGMVSESDSPYHYEIKMDLKSKNIEIAKSEIKKIIALVKESEKLTRQIPRGIGFGTDFIEFSEYNKGYGYSRLSCKPYESGWKIVKSPFYLFFTSRLDRENHVHGNIKYNVNGNFVSSEVVLWLGKRGYKYLINNNNNVPFISRIEVQNETATWITIYQDLKPSQEIVASQIDRRSYEWLKTNLPDICPKSYSGFRRMKSQNTKNYQKIVIAARNLGKEIERS